MSSRILSSTIVLSSALGVALAVPALAGHHEAGELAAKLAAAPGRAEADLARDGGRKPAEVVTFLGVAPGMTAVDLIAAGGYYTEVLSVAVGAEGKVYAQNPDFVLKYRDGANEKAISARLAGGRLANVERLDRDVADTGLSPGSVDVAVTALNFHDIYNGRGPEAAAGFLQAVKALLKPGGVLGIIDHVGKAGADNESLHRIEQAKVEAAVRAAGFELTGAGTMLANPADDGTQNVFAPSVRGKTDRFVLKLRKPAE